MLSRLATVVDLSAAAAKLKDEEQEQPQLSPRNPKKCPLTKSERLASRERLERLRSPSSRERLESGGSRHRWCCQANEVLALPSVTVKVPAKVFTPPSPFGKRLRSAPQVPQAPLRPLRQWSPRGYPFSARKASADALWTSVDSEQWKLPPAAGAEGTSNDGEGDAKGEAAMGAFIANFKSATENPQLTPGRTTPREGSKKTTRARILEVPQDETPAQVIDKEKRRVSMEAAEQLREQMRARLQQQVECLPAAPDSLKELAPPPSPPAKGACGSQCCSPRRSVRGSIRFAEHIAAGGGADKEEAGEPQADLSQALVDATRVVLKRHSQREDDSASAAAAAASAAVAADPPSDAESDSPAQPAAAAVAPAARGSLVAVEADEPLPDDAEAATASPRRKERRDSVSPSPAQAALVASELEKGEKGERASIREIPKPPPALVRDPDAVVRSTSVRSLKSRLRDRVRRLEKRHLQRQQQQKMNREQDARRLQFNCLPQEEVQAIQRVFQHMDLNGTGYLDQSEVVEGLKELGLRGSNTGEKKEITQICTEVAVEPSSVGVSGEDRDGNLVDMVDFALVVVPRIRMRLAELRSNELLRQFYAMDLRGTGKLGSQQCVEIAKDMGLDQLSFRKIVEEVHGDTDGGIDFETFQEMVHRGREHADRLIRERERRIKQATGISDEAFQEFRRDIVEIHNLFQRFDTEQKGTLGPEKLPLMLTEFGLMPKTAQERAEVEAVLRATDTDDDGVFTFEEFLHLTRQVRLLLQERKRTSLQQFFDRFDRDKNGSLNMQELSELLCDLGVVPRNRKEQDELAALFQMVDTDGSGYLDFEEFVILNQRIDQRLKSMRFEEEIEFAWSLNFTESQLRDMRLVFVTLDSDGSNKLDAHEVRNGLQMMNKQVCQDAFDAAFKALDQDNSGELDFLEFLDFMRMMRDGEGIFSEDAHHLPTKPRLVDARVLRRVVEYFGLAKTYVSALGTEELLELFCNLFEISPNDDLREKLGITTMGELFEVAKKRGGSHFHHVGP